MARTPGTATFWEVLRQDLAGSFAARAHGLLATEFVLLDSTGKEFGRLRLNGASGGELLRPTRRTSGGGGERVAAFEASGRRYRMTAENDERLLVAGPAARSLAELEISCGDRTFEARIGFLRNRATARHRSGREDGGAVVARLSGTLAGRSYETSFDPGDGCALPVAVFLLWHLATNRRRAYRTGGGTV